MFIPDPGSRILILTSRIPDPGFQKQQQKKGMNKNLLPDRDPEKTYSGSQIPDPGIKKALDPRSGSRIRNTAEHCVSR
jgi:hypothetical protein